jgi:hypothetical protein
MAFWILRFVALPFAALTLTMGSAHVLELPQKMGYDAELYSCPCWFERPAAGPNDFG